MCGDAAKTAVLDILFRLSIQLVRLIGPQLAVGTAGDANEGGNFGVSQLSSFLMFEQNYGPNEFYENMYTV